MTTNPLSQRWPWLLAAAIVIAAYLSTLVEINPPSADSRPVGTLEDIRDFADRSDTNVVFVLIDTIRADRMGMYGYERDTTPFLDEIAARGVLFERHLAQSSWTKCSMASLWTGLYPPRTGVTRFNHALPDEAVMAAEVFRDNGFVTTGIYRNGWVSGYFGFDQGFDTYMKPTPRGVPPSIRRENPTLTTQGTDIDVVETAAEFMRLHKNERFLLYLHFMDVHQYTYTAETALFGTTNSDIYDNAILHVDYVFETLFAQLEQQGLRENTLVVIGADHGEAFGERGIEGHARSVQRETTEVPLILSFPFRLEEGVVLSNRTTNVDLWPTVLDLVGLSFPNEVDGVSRREEILAGGDFSRPEEETRLAFAYLDQSWGSRGVKPQPSVAVSEGSLRFVVGKEHGPWIDTLFDADADPLERRNLAAEQPETVERLKRIASDFRNQRSVYESGARELEIDEMELNQLRALGYSIP